MVQSQEKLGPYLHKYFRHNNYASLQRQFSNCGFTRHITGSFNDTFQHPDFHRNMRTNAVSSGRAMDSDYEKESSKHSRKRSAEAAKGRPSKTPRMNCDSERGKKIVMDGSGVALKCLKLEDNKATETNDSQKSVSAKGNRARPRRSTSPKKVKVEGSAKKKQKSTAGNKPVSFNCPHCLKDFTYSFAGTAAASFSNHLKTCDPGIKEGNIKSAEQKQGRTTQRSLTAFASPKCKEIDTDPISISSKKESALEQTALKKADTKMHRTEHSQCVNAHGNSHVGNGVDRAALKKPARKSAADSLLEPTTSKPAKAARTPGYKDVILSLKNQSYKELMFTKFEILGKRTGSEEGKDKDDKMMHELFSFFKQGMGNDGQFLKSDRHMIDIWEVDDKDALEKIKMDLRRRNESLKHWFKD